VDVIEDNDILMRTPSCG